MSLHRICNDNLEPLKYSLKQADRMHLYDKKIVFAIRKIGRHFQVKTGDGWRTVPVDSNLTVLPLPEAWRSTNAV